MTCGKKALGLTPSLWQSSSLNSHLGGKEGRKASFLSVGFLPASKLPSIGLASALGEHKVEWRSLGSWAPLRAIWVEVGNGLQLTWSRMPTAPGFGQVRSGHHMSGKKGPEGEGGREGPGPRSARIVCTHTARREPVRKWRSLRRKRCYPGMCYRSALRLCSNRHLCLFYGLTDTSSISIPPRNCKLTKPSSLRNFLWQSLFMRTDRKSGSVWGCQT